MASVWLNDLTQKKRTYHPKDTEYGIVKPTHIIWRPMVYIVIHGHLHFMPKGSIFPWLKLALSAKGPTWSLLTRCGDCRTRRPTMPWCWVHLAVLNWTSLNRTHILSDLLILHDPPMLWCNSVSHHLLGHLPACARLSLFLWEMHGSA